MTAVLDGEDTAAVTGQAWGIWDRADSLFPWVPEGYAAIAAAAQALRDSLELAEDMDGLGWGSSPYLAGCAAGVAEDIAAQGEALVAAVREHMGEQAAAEIRGGEGGDE